MGGREVGGGRESYCVAAAITALLYSRLLSYLYKNLSKSQIPLKQRNNTHHNFTTRVLISKARVPKII